MYSEQSIRINQGSRDPRNQIEISRPVHFQNILNSPYRSQQAYNQNYSPPHVNVFNQAPAFQQQYQNQYQTLNYNRSNNFGNAHTQVMENPESKMSRVKPVTIQNIFFPFGKDRQRMLKRIDQHLHQDQEQNKKILQQFRLKALMDKQRGRHGSRFITQSMMPSAEYNHYLSIQKANKQEIKNRALDHSPIKQKAFRIRNPQNPQILNHSNIQDSNYYHNHGRNQKRHVQRRFFAPSRDPCQVPYQYPYQVPHHVSQHTPYQLSYQNRQYRPQIINPNNFAAIKISVGVNTPDFQGLQRRKIQLKQKKRRKQILQESSIEKFDSIEKMMAKVNDQLTKNSQILQKYSKPLIASGVSQRTERYKTLPVDSYVQQQEEQQKPKIKYSQFKNKSNDFYDKSNVSEALQQLKRYRKKIDYFKRGDR